MKTQVKLLALAIVLSAALCAAATAQLANATAEAEVRAAIVAFNQAYEKNQLDQYFSYYGANASLVFYFERTSLEDYKKMWRQLIADGGGVEKNLISDLQVVANPSGDTAFATYFLQVDTRQPDGKVNKEQANETDVWFKTADGWRLAHLNYSAQPME